jgi:hypothetical protein
MDQEALVNDQILGGATLVDLLSRNLFPISAAFWLFTSEADQWFFYLASPLVDEKGSTECYKIVHRAIRSQPGLGVGPFEVELIGPDEPLARAVSRLIEESGSPSATRIRRRYLGDVFIEQAYIYPLVRPDAVASS